MNTSIWPEIIIALVASGASWFFNKLTLKAELKKTKGENINAKRLSLYQECFALLEQNTNNNNIVFNYTYVESLIRIKPQMKLLASSNVLFQFKIYYMWVTSIYKTFVDFCEQKDPTSRVHTVTTSDGISFDVVDFNENDLEHFEYLQKAYINERNIQDSVVKSKTDAVLNAMRTDLGNDTFSDFRMT